MAFIRGANPIWLLADLTGKLFDDTFYLWVLENQIPYNPAVVYHDIDGNIPWTSPIQFLANGTLPVDIFWDDNVVYRLEFRKNNGTAPPSQADALIYLVENYSPNATGGTPSTITESATNNQITNPQFAEISFPNPYVIAATNPNSIEVAPGWFLDLAGTGTLTLQREALNDTIPTPTNAPYALRIVLGGGWTGTPILRQRLQQNGQLWANKYVATSFTARIEGASQTISALLVASDGQPLGILKNAVLTNAFTEFDGEDLLPASTNANTPPAAYIEYRIQLPTICDIWITSFQLIASSTPVNVPYEQDTIDRQLDHLFHYYNPLLQYKPIPSYLTGWDFPLNPAQLGTAIGPIATGVNKSFYAWDQTVIFQTVDNAISVSREATTGAIVLTGTLASSAAIIQYLDATQAREILSGRCAVAIKAKSSATKPITIGLYATNDANLPSLLAGTYNSLVTTIGASGAITVGAGGVNGTWTALSRNNPGSVQTSVTTTGIEQTFNGWFDNTTTPRVGDATFFAIVIGIETLTLGATITFDYISLNAGDIATRPAPQTADEVLRECERYYEMSYASATVVNTVTSVNAISFPQNATQISGGNTYAQPNAMTIFFNSKKRITNPTLSIYSPQTAGAGAGFVSMRGLGGAALNVDTAIANWTVVTGDKICNFIPAVDIVGAPQLTSAPTTPVVYSASFHYIADARLGIVN